MKYLYIVDYWVPFPQSEYGGVVNVIAENDAEAFDKLLNEEQFHPDYRNRILPNVIKAQKFELKNDYESGIVDAFVT